jgi:hypothetical protein
MFTKLDGPTRFRRRCYQHPIIKTLDQVSEITALGLAELGAEALVPPRRLGELARYGMSADASLIRHHGSGRRLATVRHLEPMLLAT